MRRWTTPRWYAQPPRHKLGSMAIEIERKFLLREVPGWLDGCESHEIRQGYVALEADTEVRIRRQGDAHTLTIKRGGGLVRVEVEVDLDAERFEALWPLTEGRRVSKRRYLVPTEHLHFDVDVFADGLAGMRVAEVEFASVAASEAFAPPPWLGPEVTTDERFKNRTLAERGRPS